MWYWIEKEEQNISNNKHSSKTHLNLYIYPILKNHIQINQPMYLKMNTGKTFFIGEFKICSHEQIKQCTCLSPCGI